MSNKMLRILIVVAVVALVCVVIYRSRSGDGSNANVGEEKRTYSVEERKDLLVKTVDKRWTAMQNDDWVTLYEMMSPQNKQETTLTAYLQGKNLIFYENAEVLEAYLEGDMGYARIKHDWGANLEVKPDIGEAVKRGMIIKEGYTFDEATGAWYVLTSDYEPIVTSPK